MYKQSYYTISTPVSEAEGKEKYILFSTRTSEAVVLNKTIYDNWSSGKFDLLDEESMKTLIQKRFIVNDHEDELGEIIRENKEVSANETLLYEVIQPSANCQLGCDYCGQVHTKRNLDSDLLDRIFLRVEKKLRSNDKYKGLKIGWFGGEPLMALKEMRILTKRFQALCAELNVKYSGKVVTNGLSLKENIFVELASDLSIDSVEITLDGTEEYHDKRRNTKEGVSTFDLIFKNLLDIVNREDYRDLKCSISIRCNVDKRNFEGVTPLIRKLAAHKLQDKISHFYVASVYSWGNDAHLKSFVKPEFAELEIEWIIEMYKNGFQPYLYPGRVKSVCMAVSPTSEMYDAYGNVFNCTEVSYVPVYENTNYVLGNLKKDEVTKSERMHTNWNDQIQNNEFQCHSCKMLPVCGGGCPKQWTEGRQACPSPKYNIKERLLLSYIHAKKGIKELSEMVEVEANS